MQGSHGSAQDLAHTLPAFSESVVSSRRGALGARLGALLESLVSAGRDNEATVEFIGADSEDRRNSHGLAGNESTLPTPLWATVCSSSIRLGFLLCGFRGVNDRVYVVSGLGSLLGCLCMAKGRAETESELDARRLRL